MAVPLRWRPGFVVSVPDVRVQVRRALAGPAVQFIGMAIPRGVVALFACTAIAAVLRIVAIRAMVPFGSVAVDLGSIPALIGAGWMAGQQMRLRRYDIGVRAVVAGVVLGVFVYVLRAFVDGAGWSHTVSVTLALIQDDVTYGMALPVTVAVLLRTRRLHERDVLVMSFAVAIVLSMIVPEHRDVIRDAGAFISMSLLVAYAIWRGRAIAVALMAHAVTVYALADIRHVAGTQGLRTTIAALVLACLCVAAASAPRPLSHDVPRHA